MSSFPHDESGAFRADTCRHAVQSVVSPLYPTMLHALDHAARKDDTTGITLLDDCADRPEEHRSYRQLYRQSRSVAAHLAGLGVKVGDNVLVVLPTGFEFITTFFGIQLLGAVPVPSYPPAALARADRAVDRLRHIARSAGATMCITTKRLRTLLGQLTTDGCVQSFVAVESLREHDTVKKAEIDRVSTKPAFIQCTSGSTDQPKGVVLSHGNLVMNIHAMGEAMRIGHEDRGASWLPLYHDMGLIGGLLTSIYCGMPLALMSPLAFLADPLRWLETIDVHKATISPAPNFAFALCAKRAKKAPQRVAKLNLSSWRVALNGAERVDYGVVEDFQATFGSRGFSKTAMLPVYGLAEATLAVSFPDVDEAPRREVVDRRKLAAGHALHIDESSRNAMSIVSVGRPLPGHECIVVDGHGHELPERAVGHVVVRGPSVMQGYFDQPDETAEVLADGTLWTGDLGYVSAGELYITGRTKDLVILHGRNYYSEDLEHIAGTVPGVRAGGVVAFGVQDESDASEVAVMVCETKVTDQVERQRIARRVTEAVADNCGVRLEEMVLAEPGTIPKTPSGKPQRSLARQRYLANELGPGKTGRLSIALLFLRSGGAFLASSARRFLASRRPPD